MHSNTLLELHLLYQGKLLISSCARKILYLQVIMIFAEGLNGDANAVHDYNSFTESDSKGVNKAGRHGFVLLLKFLRTYLYFSCCILVDVYLLTIFQ